MRNVALEKMNGRKVESLKDTMKATDRKISCLELYKNPTQVFAGMFASIFFHLLVCPHVLFRILEIAETQVMKKLFEIVCFS